MRSQPQPCRQRRQGWGYESQGVVRRARQPVLKHGPNTAYGEKGREPAIF